jgi:hypothetical protein
MGDLDCMPLNGFEFRENRCGESRTVFRGVKGILRLFFTIIYPIAIKFCTRDVFKNVLGDLSSVKSAQWKSYLWEYMNF